MLTGVWSGTTAICPSPLYPEGATFAASYTAQLDLAGRVLLGREVRRRGGRIVYQGLTVLGWDADRGQFTLLFDTLHQHVIEPAFGEWRKNALTLDQSTREGQLRFSYVVEDDKHCAKDAEPIVATANRAVLDQLLFSDRQDFEDAKRGFIATVPDERSSQRSRSRP